MNNHEITRNVAKHNNYSPSANLFNSSVQSKLVEEQPDQVDSALAHEIRNPLSSINLATQMLQSIITDNYQKIYLDIILRNSMRINDIVTDLLAPRLRVEEMQLEKHSMHQLLDEVLVMSQDWIMFKKITVLKEYAEQDCTIVMNRQKMKIALTNIVVNAIDAMPSENGQLKLITKSIKNRWVVEIEDNGTGISKKNLKTIFKPYFTDKPGGMGLGLSTTLDILHSNHARTNVQSEQGKGTRFILSFDRVSTDREMVCQNDIPAIVTPFGNKKFPVILTPVAAK